MDTILVFIARSSISLRLHAVAQGGERLGARLDDRGSGVVSLVEDKLPPLLLVAAANESGRRHEGDCDQRRRPDHRGHDGRLQLPSFVWYAVPQPQAPEPKPRAATRSR